MNITSRTLLIGALSFFLPLGCSSSAQPPKLAAAPTNSSEQVAAKPTADAAEGPALVASKETVPMADIDAWTAASKMIPGTNIGNTLENTTTWETGWGNPLITREYVQSLAKLGFKSVRIPVAWDTYAVDGKIQPDKMQRVAEVADWVVEAGMFAVVNIHWDGGWIDSSKKETFPDTHATFSPAAEKKFRSYWEQIATYFEDRNEKLIFEALNEETNFSGEGSEQKAYATLTRVNQLFVDTVRGTGGNNAKRLLVVTGYHTDIAKTSSDLFVLPKDTAANKLFISVHYYTPWTFCGLGEDAKWGKVKPTWGSPADVKELEGLFDRMAQFSKKHDIPVYVGEYNATEKRESASRIKWLDAVTQASISRKMVPVLWDTGGEVSRKAPYGASPVLEAVLKNVPRAAEAAPSAPLAGN